jgi:subtilisin family serine protease
MTLLVAVGVVLVASATPAFASLNERSERAVREGHIPGQYIVVFKDSVTDADGAEASILSGVRGEKIDSYRYAVRGFSARFSDEDVADVKNDPRVLFVSEDREVSVASHRTASAQSRVQAQTLPTGVNRINAETLQNKGAGVQVAVIDTGIAVDHSDLKANIAGGKNCTNRTNYKDENGHGTHVAGTIAALDNSAGVVGVAPQAKLWSVRVLDRFGNGSWSSVICGLDFVASKGPLNGGPITVANLSLGGSGVSDNNCGNSNNDALHKAICRVRDAGVTIVVAAGNSGSNANSFVPAAYDDAVITVSALADSDGAPAGLGAATSYGKDDTFASFSNFGAVVDIAAPGVSIYSTWLNNAYSSISGTSMASPHVAGAAALYIAAHPGATWTQVRDGLLGLAEPLGAGHSDPSNLHPESVLRAEAI